MAKISKIVDRINNKKATPTLKKNKFSSVSEMAKSGSPLARNLFGSGLSPEGEETDLQFVQRTGKVSLFPFAHDRLKVMADKIYFGNL